MITFKIPDAETTPHDGTPSGCVFTHGTSDPLDAGSLRRTPECATEAPQMETKNQFILPHQCNNEKGTDQVQYIKKKSFSPNAIIIGYESGREGRSGAH